MTEKQPCAPSYSPAGKGTKTLILVTFSIASFLPSFMAQGLNIALPIIGREYSADAITLNWMVLAFVLANAALSMPIGRISDVVGIRKVFIYGMIVYTLASFAVIFSNSPLMIIICRVAQGIGGSMILVNLMALITVIFSAEERGLALGINVASVYVGASIGPFLGGLLTESFGWKSIFLANVFIGLIVIILTLWKISGGKIAGHKQKIDYAGSVVYSLSFVILIYGFSRLPGISGGVLILAGLLGLFLFIAWEKRVDSPVFDIKVFRRNRLFIFSNLAALMNYVAVFAVAFLLSLYLQYIKGLTPVVAGFVLIAHPVVQTIVSPLAGRLSDKMEPRVVASVGMGLATLSLISFAFLGKDTPVAAVIVALVVLGTGFALFLSPNANAIMSSVDQRYYGVASATMSTMIAGGQTLSMGITMIVMSIVIGKVAVTPEYYPAFLTSVKIAFGIFACLCGGGVIISSARGKMR
jgi:EmrB/QacA subfamily drug resistance transporter